jgi:hypothetical protein
MQNTCLFPVQKGLLLANAYKIYRMTETVLFPILGNAVNVQSTVNLDIYRRKD